MLRRADTARSFTLAELLIALALIGAIAATVLPAIASRLGGARAQAAVRQIETMMMEAGAVAAHEGVVVRVVAREAPGGVLVESRRAELARARGDEAFGGAGEVPPARAPIESIELKSGESISERPAEGRPAEEVTAPADGMRAGGAPREEELLLATFLPDGTALGTVFYLSVAGGTTYEMAVERWTGRIRIERLEGEEDGATAGDSADDDAAGGAGGFLEGPARFGGGGGHP